MQWLVLMHGLSFLLAGWFMMLGSIPATLSGSSRKTRLYHFTIGLVLMIVVVNSMVFFGSHLPK